MSLLSIHLFVNGVKQCNTNVAILWGKKIINNALVENYNVFDEFL